MDLSILDFRACRLVERVMNGCQNQNLGSMTVAIYDTAWASMLYKTTQGQTCWLFSECFRFLLDHQLPEGGWESYACKEDGILDTLAGLLALIKHRNISFRDRGEDVPDLEVRISNAKKYLETELQDWDVESSMRVGFEILIPTLLELLESEKMCFTFPGRHTLRRLNEKKLKNFDPNMLYSSDPTSLLHSLEGFIGKIDFDRLSHHLRFGSMMGSPASTVAYMMYSSTWDDEAELYIRKVIAEGEGNGSGGLPSAFPIPIFESTWVLSTLLQGAFSIDALGKENVMKIASYLEGHLQAQHGLLGFAPALLADVDDTAKTILTLNLLERATSPDEMVEHFKSNEGHFRTYPGERDPSFSANCNVLKALLQDPHVEKYEHHIATIAGFLCDSWWSGAVNDKWNTALQYPIMLLAEALMRILHLWDKGSLKLLPETLLRDRMPVVLIQILNRTLLTQKPNGAWDPDNCAETTAYAILTLRAVSPLPWYGLLKEEVSFAIKKGQQYLSQKPHEWAKPKYLWIEKVAYGSTNLSEVYCLAAMKLSEFQHSWSNRTDSLVEVSEKFVSRFMQFFRTLKEFQDEPIWKLKLSAIEGYVFLPQLKSAPMEILQRQKGAKNEYLNYIPCTWTLINNLRGLFLRANILWDMMVLTMCNFRVDEYMETVVANFGKDKLETTKSIVVRLCTENEAEKRQTRKRPHEDSVRRNIVHSQSFDCSEAVETYDLAGFEAVISRYVRAMLNYPRIQDASSVDQSHVRSELQAFLLAHINQIQDNVRFSNGISWHTETTGVFWTPKTSYYNWANTIGAVSVSCPFSFAFFTCLLQSTSLQFADCFPCVRQRYLADDLCSRLAVMSRLYNDYGSVARDRAEGNINSIDFPEFYTSPHDNALSGEGQAAKEVRLKADLLGLAQYERECAGTVAERLVKDLRRGFGDGKTKARCVMLFVGVVDLYADMYVAKDLSNRIKKSK